MAKNSEERIVEIIVNGQKAEASLKDMKAAASVLNNQLQKLTPGTQEFINKSKQLQEVRTRIKGVETDLRGVEKATETAKGGFMGLGKASDLLKMSFQAATAALLPLFAFQKLVELVNHFFQLESEVSKLKGTLATMSGAGGQELDELATHVQALSSTFEKENNEIIKAANALSKHMNISYQESLDLIEKGLLAGADLNGDFLEQLSEYAPQFRDAGIAAKDFVAEIVKSENAGIFTDKGADLIKEFGLRIREQTKATKDALNDALGPEFTAKLFKGVNDGSISTVDALKMVSKGLNDTKIPAAQLQTVVADVFGGPGEDAGLEYIKSLQNVGGELDSMIDKNNVLTSTQLEQLEVEKELAAAQIALANEFQGSGSIIGNLTTIVQTFAINGLLAIINHVKTLRNEFVGSIEYIKSFGRSIQAIFSAIASGDFDQVLKDFDNIGSSASKAFNEGYFRADKQAAADKKILQAQEAETARKKAEEEAKKLSEAERVAREKANAEAADARKKEEEKRAKERLAEAKKLRDDYQAKSLAAEKAYEDLKVSVMEEGLAKSLAQLELKHKREQAEIEKNRLATLANTAITEEEKAALIATYREQQDLIDAQYKQAKIDAEAEQKEKEKEKTIEEMELAEEARLLEVETQFMNAVNAEQAKEDALYEIRRQALENRIALESENGAIENATVLKLRNELLKLEKDHNAAKLESVKTTEEAKRKIQEAGFGAARDFVNMGLELFNKEQAERGKNAKLFKAFSKAKILLDSAQEIQAIWRNANASPMNILLPGSGSVIAGIQTAMALVRTRNAVKQVDAQQFAGGGFTGPGLSVSSGGKLTDSTGFAVAGVVHQDEWVAPKWMVEHPKYANVIGYLESSRRRGFVEGGFTSSAMPPAGAMPTWAQGPGAIDPAANSSAMQMVQLMMTLIDETRAYRQELSTWQRQLEVVNDPMATFNQASSIIKVRNDAKV